MAALQKPLGIFKRWFGSSLAWVFAVIVLLSA
jgi:hypothetical protein